MSTAMRLREKTFNSQAESKLVTGSVYITRNTEVWLVPVGVALRKESYVFVSAAAVVTLSSQQRSLSAPAASSLPATVNTSAAAAAASAALRCEK